MWHEQFEQDHRDLIDQVKVDTEHQGWFVFSDGSAGWRNLDDPAVGPDATGVREDDDPDVAASPGPGGLRRGGDAVDLVRCHPDVLRRALLRSACTVSCPKLDDQAIYELTCLVTLKPNPGHEHCPPTVF